MTEVLLTVTSEPEKLVVPVMLFVGPLIVIVEPSLSRLFVGVHLKPEGVMATTERSVWFAAVGLSSEATSESNATVPLLSGQV